MMSPKVAQLDAQVCMNQSQSNGSNNVMMKTEDEMRSPYPTELKLTPQPAISSPHTLFRNRKTRTDFLLTGMLCYNTKTTENPSLSTSPLRYAASSDVSSMCLTFDFVGSFIALELTVLEVAKSKILAVPLGD
ncbi:hypothetical protein TcWFU_000440 [Taenia crassiceps]|uniref:Uncharacterized protein n=1 Tax=Taenia crassiceps TaxID=6207 RepID=A0ABR4QJQ3_9CEST